MEYYNTRFHDLRTLEKGVDTNAKISLCRAFFSLYVTITDKVNENSKKIILC